MKRHELTDEQWELIEPVFAETHRHHGSKATPPAANAQWHLVGAPHRSTLAGLARAIRTLADGLRLLSKLARRWDLRPSAPETSDSSGPRGQDRLEFVVHRWFVGSGVPGRCRDFKKKLQPTQQRTRGPRSGPLKGRIRQQIPSGY